jgi:hypothetical protein
MTLVGEENGNQRLVGIFGASQIFSRNYFLKVREEVQKKVPGLAGQSIWRECISALSKIAGLSPRLRITILFFSC